MPAGQAGYGNYGSYPNGQPGGYASPMPYYGQYGGSEYMGQPPYGGSYVVPYGGGNPMVAGANGQPGADRFNQGQFPGGQPRQYGWVYIVCIVCILCILCVGVCVCACGDGVGGVGGCV